MDALWPDRDPAAAANNLNQAVHAARKALGAEAIELQDGLLRLEAELDVEAFELAAADARRDGTAAACERALALYGGELLPENRYDDWAELERGRLAALARRARADARRPRRQPGQEAAAARDEHLRRPRARARRAAGAARPHPPAHARRHRRRRQDAARARARARPRGRAGRRRRPRRARLRSPTGADVPDAVAEALDLRALPGGALVDAIADGAGTARAPARARQLRARDRRERGARRRAPSLGAAPDDPRHQPRAAARPGRGRLPRPVARDPRPGRRRAARRRCSATRPCASSSSAPARRRPASSSTRRTRPRWRASAIRLDGLPLALELAAARLDALAAAALAERLDDRFRLLRAGSRTAPTRQQTLEAALDWSYELLADVERVAAAPPGRLRGRLHPRGGGGSVLLATGSSRRRSRTCSHGSSRSRSSPPRSARAPGATGCSRRSAPTRAFVSPRQGSARLSPCARPAGSRGSWTSDDSQLSGLDPERGNLRAALETLLAGDPPAALRLCARVWPFWLRRIELSEARRWLGDALEHAPEPSPVRVRALLGQAAVEFRAGSGDARLGLDDADEALPLARELGEPELEWRAIHFRGGIEIAREDGRAAAGHFEAALAVAREHRLAAPEAVSVYSLGVAAWVAGDLAAAEERMAESAGLFAAPRRPGARPCRRSSTSPRSRSRIRARPVCGSSSKTRCCRSRRSRRRRRRLRPAQLGERRPRGRRPRARPRAARGGARRGSSGRGASTAGPTSGRGSRYLAARRGRRSRRRRSCSSVRATLRTRRGDRRGAALALVGLGHAAVAAGDYARAEALLREAADTFRRAGDRWGLVSTLWRTAELEQARDRLDRARRSCWSRRWAWWRRPRTAAGWRSRARTSRRSSCCAARKRARGSPRARRSTRSPSRGDAQGVDTCAPGFAASQSARKREANRPSLEPCSKSTRRRNE